MPGAAIFWGRMEFGVYVYCFLLDKEHEMETVLNKINKKISFRRKDPRLKKQSPSNTDDY